MNVVLAVALATGGVALLQQDAFFLGERWEPEVGTRFAGCSLRFLAGTLFGLAAFASVVAVGWIRRAVPPPAERLLVHPAYKGQILVRYWYLVLFTLVCFALAFLLAERRVPNPALLPVSSETVPPGPDG